MRKPPTPGTPPDPEPEDGRALKRAQQFQRQRGLPLTSPSPPSPPSPPSSPPPAKRRKR